MAEDLSKMSPEQIAALQKQNCIFCKIISGEIPAKVVHKDKYCFAALDINPANEGHILLLPKEHYQIMPQVPDEVLSHMFNVAKKISKGILMSTVGKSTSIFVANGAAAGQKAPHFMIHIIPRKTPDEFLSIPSKDASQDDLETLRKAITAKISGLTVYAPKQDKQEHPEKKEITHAEENKNPPPEFVLDGNKIAKLGIKREPGYLYYIDEDGDIARTLMARGRKKKAEKVKKISKKEKVGKSEIDNNEDGPASEKPTLDDISRMLLGG